MLPAMGSSGHINGKRGNRNPAGGGLGMPEIDPLAITADVTYNGPIRDLYQN